MKYNRLRFQALTTLLILAVGIVGRAQSAQVTLTLEINTLAQSWQLFGEANLGDNDGLASVGIDMWNVDFPVDLQLPASWIGSNDWEGFTQGRTDSTNPMGATQNTFTNSGLVYGFGQVAGSLDDTLADTFVQQNYDAKLLLAQGTYPTASLLPDIDNDVIRVFPVGGGTPFEPTVVYQTFIIPEPASASLLVFGAAVLWRVRRRSG